MISQERLGKQRVWAAAIIAETHGKNYTSQQKRRAMAKTINLYTDGSCLGNPGPGGYGYVLEWGDYRIFGADGMTETTNNRQELYAVIYGLNRIEKRDVPVVVFSDSDYVVKGVSTWLDKWKARDWKNANNKPVKNKDIWEMLDELINEFDDIKFK